MGDVFCSAGFKRKNARDEGMQICPGCEVYADYGAQWRADDIADAAGAADAWQVHG